MKFQDSKPEIGVPESKVYILPSKMYTFWNLEMKFQDSKLEIGVPKSRVYILPGRMYTFWNFGRKFQDSKLEIGIPKSKVYILPGKIYTFGSGLVFSKSIVGSGHMPENIHFAYPQDVE